MVLSDVLKRSVEFLKKKGLESSRWEAEALLAHGLGVGRVDLYMRPDYPLSEAEMQKLRELVVQRSQGVPLAYITGQKAFYKSTFAVEPGVLIPRDDSEVLVEKLLEKIPMDSDAVVMDWGSGSGCLGLSLLLERPNLRLIAVEKEAVPMRVTTHNAETLKLSERVSVLHKSVEDITAEDAKVFGPVPRYLISNPPYVKIEDPDLSKDVRDHEPHTALISEEEGLFHLKSWLALANQKFSDLEHIIFEIGWDQAYPMTEYVAQELSHWSLKVHQDLGGRDRALDLQRPHL